MIHLGKEAEGKDVEGEKAGSEAIALDGAKKTKSKDAVVKTSGSSAFLQTFHNGGPKYQDADRIEESKKSEHVKPAEEERDERQKKKQKMSTEKDEV